jgi:hypothetical protein
MWNETDWNDEPSSSYSKAKTTAERKGVLCVCMCVCVLCAVCCASDHLPPH